MALLGDGRVEVVLILLDIAGTVRNRASQHQLTPGIENGSVRQEAKYICRLKFIDYTTHHLDCLLRVEVAALVLNVDDAVLFKQFGDNPHT